MKSDDSTSELIGWWRDGHLKNKMFIVLFKMVHRDGRNLELFGDKVLEIVPWEDIDGY